MNLTAYHATYFAHELTKRCPSDSIEKLAGALADAQVDLNPHQIEAALFSFQSPLSKGALLADEVGLGKTIEAGIILSQKWAEKKRNLLVIVPSNLRKQWSQELSDKFYLPSAILETRTFNEYIRNGNLNPFKQDCVVICSFQFARTKEPYIAQTPWDLIVIDEAHRLRNVYKPTNKIANAIKNAVAPFPKVLLTATPLQNSLLELYGLVSIIDDYVFGDLPSFRMQFTRLGDREDFSALKDRIKTVCKRTLRKQVLEYIKYTNRHAIVQEFMPSTDEQRLYDLVSEYLQRPSLYALPSSQRQLMTLMLRKLLASSTHAISGTLEGLAKKLEYVAQRAEEIDTPPEDIIADLENFPEVEDEWEEEEEEDNKAAKEVKTYTQEELIELRSEMRTLQEFHSLAKSILRNSKGEVLLTALRKGFAAAQEARKALGAQTLQPKALIFTESRRTQEYLLNILEKTEFAGKIVLFNGTNTDERSRIIYQEWLRRNEGSDKVSGSPTADKRAAIVEYFRDQAEIMIATEAAAEGINLQFCNLVVNYDLPWNPQRIEQRIGRCHRYGQRFDVVVVNFLNKNNAADKRVYELLDQKFRLFNGVFGASDEVLGTIESGVDFEKRIVAIYQRCRSPEQIAFEFDQLQHELETEIDDKRREARDTLLNNFDQEVVEKVRISSSDYLDRYSQWLWNVSRFFLAPYADFAEPGYSFTLHTNPFPEETINRGPYRMGKNIEDANTYRTGHPLAQRILEKSRTSIETPATLRFDYTGSGKNIAALKPLIGSSGWLLCSFISINAFEAEDYILFAGITDSGNHLDMDQCRYFFNLAAHEETLKDVSSETKSDLNGMVSAELTGLCEKISSRNGQFFDIEMDKLDRWAEDRKNSLKSLLNDIDARIKELKREARVAPNLPAKLEMQRELRMLESKRNDAWREYDEASNDIEKKKDGLLDDIGKRLDQKIERKELFTIRWELR